MKLNLGCGKRHLAGYTNVDLAPTADLVADVRAVPLPDECAEEVLAVHVIEHFYKWEVQPLLAEWRRLLVPGGLLVIECPDIVKAAQNLIDGMGSQMTMWPLYGDPGHQDPLMCHRWGYSPGTLIYEVQWAGFRKVKTLEPQWHGKRINRDMRLEAIK